MSNDVSVNKHFVDSSVAQPMLLGSKRYKEYLAEQFAGDTVYISKYVQMEVKRSCIAPMIHFYFVLDMPSIETLGDALSVWSNRFRGGEIKAVMRLMADVIDTHGLSISESSDKQKALRRLGFVIKRIEAALRQKFVDIGINTTRCKRAQLSIGSSETELLSLSEQLKSFITQFDDTELCRSQCRIDDFLLNRFRHEVELSVSYARTLKSPKSQGNRGFVQISEHLAKIVEEGEKTCSCRMCGNIGDAVIAFETPRTMRLEHTDYSFDQLCTLVKQPHYRHWAETELHKQAVQNSSSSSDENE